MLAPVTSMTFDKPTVAPPRGTVLVADHARTNRLRLQDLLERENYLVVVASNGAEAIDRFRAVRPDIIIMDEEMPDCDGYEATRRIKAELGEDFIPVLFLTSSTEESVLSQCVACGGDDFLTKPFHPPLLRAKLEALSRIRALYQSSQRQMVELTRYRAGAERDLQLAKRVFSNVAHSAVLDGRHLRHLHRAAATVNGDLLLAATTVDGGLRALVGDFTGHGLSAAIGAMPVSDVFYQMTRKGFPVVDVVQEINEKLRAILPTGHFLAGCVLEVDPACDALTVWNGGMPDVLVYTGADAAIYARVPSKHLPLGTIRSAELGVQPEVMKIAPGDRLYIISDGLVEAENASGERLGSDALEREICAHKDADQIFGGVVELLDGFLGADSPHDDVTFLEVQCEPDAFPRDGYRNRLGTRAPGNWTVELDFDSRTLQSGHPIPLLAPMLLEYEGLGAHWRNISTVLTELYSNALEHGVLRMDSGLKKTPEGFAEYYRERDLKLASLSEGWIRLAIRNYAGGPNGRLEITMEDSGDGFDTNQALPSFDGNDTLSGRGIALVEALCSDVKYNDKGNCARVVYEWD